MLSTKAMHVTEIFGLSTFPVFRHCPTFDSRNMSGILILVSNVRKFCETYRKFSRKCLPKIISENVAVTKLLTETNVIAGNPG